MEGGGGTWPSWQYSESLNKIINSIICGLGETQAASSILLLLINEDSGATIEMAKISHAIWESKGNQNLFSFKLTRVL